MATTSIPSTAAKSAARAVMAELKSRSGIRQALDDCDSNIVKELTTTLAEIIDKKMAKA